MNSFNTLQVILKVSERCNLSCTYCYYFFAGDNTYERRPPLISGETAQAVAKFLAEGVRELGIPRLLIAFHGGEPTLLKPDKLQAICQMFKEQVSAIAPSTALGFQMQTNGVLLNDDWMRVIREERIEVGVSIDGPKAENDKFRIANNGNGTHDATVAGLRRLQQEASNSNGRLPMPGTISVVNAGFDYKKIVRYLIEQLQVDSFSFLLPDVQHDTGLPPGSTAERYGEILCDIFDAWIATGATSKIRNIERLLSYFQEIKEVERPVGVGSRTQVVVIQSDGELSIDDTYMVALDWRMAQTTPHVTSTTLVEYLNLPIFSEISKHWATLPKACTDCDWRRICRGGDLENRYSAARGFDNPSIYCEGLQKFYLHVAKYLVVNGYPLEKMHGKLGLSPIM